MTESLIDSRQLRAFVELAKVASFTKAARVLHLSQSAISHSIKSLETELGCELLERRGKLIALTQSGQWLLQRANTIMSEMKAAREDLARLKAWGQGNIRMGASSTACQYVLPRAIVALRDKYPKWTVQVSTCDTEAALEAVRDGTVDLALAMRTTHDDPDLEARDLFEEQVSWIVPAAHPWAKDGFDPKSVSRQTLITYSARSFLMRSVRSQLQQHQVRLPPSMIELGSLQPILDLVTDGQGITVMATWIAQTKIDSGDVVAIPLPGPPLVRQWVAVIKRGRRLHLAEELFIRCCSQRGAQ
jgi:LysR family transcriptional regulator, low CO2-responsive transcriptional regulator